MSTCLLCGSVPPSRWSLVEKLEYGRSKNLSRRGASVPAAAAFALTLRLEGAATPLRQRSTLPLFRNEKFWRCSRVLYWRDWTKRTGRVEKKKRRRRRPKSFNLGRS